jgi:ferredoxin
VTPLDILQVAMPLSRPPSNYRLRVIADRNACCGYGVCVEMCPEVYQMDEGGKVVLVSDYVPKGAEIKARNGASACPQNALKIVDEPDSSP